MISIYYHIYTRFFSASKWAFYYQQMPKAIQERIDRYQKKENKYQLLLGRLLLKHGMHELGFADFQLNDLHYNEFNCPLWKEDVCFSIAHSENVIACAITTEDALIGLDIEKERMVNLNHFDHVLNALDYANIGKASDKSIAFFKIWTIKESITKALQKGLAIDVKGIEVKEKIVRYKQQNWSYNTLDIAPNFAAHIVTNKEIALETTIKNVAF